MVRKGDRLLFCHDSWHRCTFRKVACPHFFFHFFFPFLFRVRIVTRRLNHYDKLLLPDVRDLDGDGLDC